MIKRGKGGGNTKTGLNFERDISILSVLEKTREYSVKGDVIFYKNKKVAMSFSKHGLYRYLNSRGVDYKKIISKKLLPDEAIYVIKNNILFIIEMKFQEVFGSVDEKLQTCDFKKKQYKKLMSSINIDVEYIYILNDWFKKPEYRDVLDYVISVGCYYYFHYLPLKKIGLPVPK